MLITWHDVNKFLNCIRIQDSYEWGGEYFNSIKEQ